MSEQFNFVNDLFSDEEEQQIDLGQTITPPGEIEQDVAPPAAEAATPEPQETPSVDTPSIADNIRDPIGTASIFVADALDNLIGGDQFTPEQMRENQRRADEARKNRELGVTDYLGEPMEVVNQSVVGAAESVLETAELIGDTGKTFLNQLFPEIVPLDDKDNIFSDKYQAFQWDLGSDDMAKTGIGKVAAGFGEFGVLMYATGGFGGAGIVQSGLRGLAADFISSPEDGNLSNLIKEHAPEWYPTWLTALAVEEGENPWLSRFKTALEGFGLGVAADSAVSYVKGRAAFNKAKKQGATDEQAATAGLTAAREADVQADLSIPRTESPLSAELSGANYVTRSVDLGGDMKGEWFFTNDKGAIEVSWDVEGTRTGAINLGRMRTDFRRLIAEGNFEPGTVLYNLPIPDDSLSRVSGAQQRRIDAAAPKEKVLEVARRLAKASGLEFDDLEYMRADGPERGTQVDFLNRAKNTLVEIGGRETNTRARIYERMGFGPLLPNTSAQYGQVVQDSNGRLIVRPITPPAGIVTPQQYENWYASVREDYLVASNPNSYDNVARRNSEYFEVGERQFSAESDAVVRRLMNNLGDHGVFDPQTGQRIEEGAMVVIDKADDLVDTDNITQFFINNQEALSRNDAFIEVRGDANGGNFVRIVRVLNDATEADRLAREFDLEGWIDLNGYQPFPVGGADDLRPTAGLNQRNITQRPSNPVPPGTGTVVDAGGTNVRIGDATSAAAGQTVAARSGTEVRGSGGSVLSNSARRLIAGEGTAARDVIDQIAESLDIERLEKAAGTTFDEIRREAAEWLQDWNGNFGDIPTETTSTGDKFLQPKHVVAVKTMMLDVSTRLSDIGLDIVRGTADYSDMSQQAIGMVEDLKVLMELHKTSARHYGVGLGSYRIPALGLEIPASVVQDAVTPEAVDSATKGIQKTLDDIIEGLKSGDPKKMKEAAKLANGIAMAGGDPSKIKTIAAYSKQIFMDDALSMMYNSMLSGPPTHIVNTLGNLINTVMRPASAALGGTSLERKMAAAAFANFGETIHEALRVARISLETGSAINDGGKGFVKRQDTERILDGILKEAEFSGDSGKMFRAQALKMFHDFTNFPLLELPNTFLTTSDEFFKTVVARMEFNSRTMMDAVKEGGDSIDEVFKLLVQKRSAAAFDAATGMIKDENLLQVAKETTYQQDLIRGDGYLGAMAAASDFMNKMPVMRLFFPFLKTGHNIMVYAGSHMPGVNRLLAEYHTTMKGKDEYAKAVMRGRERFGTLFLASAGFMAATGMMTGNGPSDPRQRKEWLKNNQPRSIRIGGKWVSYDRIEPANMFYSAVADVVYAVNENQMAEKDGEYLITQLAYILGMNLTQKSFLQGLVPLSQLTDPSNTNLERLALIPAEALNNFLPLAGARRAFANIVQPYYQEYQSNYDRFLRNAAAGFAGNGAPKYDWLTGEKIMATSGGWNALSPIKVHDRKVDEVKDALEDINFEFDDVFKDKGDIDFTADMRSQIQLSMGKSGLRDELKKILLTGNGLSGYLDDAKEQIRKGRIAKEDLGLYKEVRQKVSEYKALAVADLLNENSKLYNKEFAAEYHTRMRNKDLANLGRFHLMQDPN